MRSLFPVLTVLCGASPHVSADDGERRWDGRRVLLVRSALHEQERREEQRAALAADLGGLAARDVLVLEWTGEQEPEVWPPGCGGSAPDVAARCGPDVSAEAWRVVLIGRDGQAKASWNRIVPAAEIFARIDAMPMGRREKEERESGRR